MPTIDSEDGARSYRGDLDLDEAYLFRIDFRLGRLRSAQPELSRIEPPRAVFLARGFLSQLVAISSVPPGIVYPRQPRYFRQRHMIS